MIVTQVRLVKGGKEVKGAAVGFRFLSQAVDGDRKLTENFVWIEN